jgi:hypothetical protein
MTNNHTLNFLEVLLPPQALFNNLLLDPIELLLLRSQYDLLLLLFELFFSYFFLFLWLIKSLYIYIYCDILLEIDGREKA